jgi:hypothetical protein
MAVFTRRPNPPSYANYHLYKPFLRVDFKYRCAYCRLHEGDQYGGGFHNFQIDHFRPHSLPAFTHLINEYSNLYYSCRWCNRAKWETWPSEQQRADGYEFVDPCKEDLYRAHCRLKEDGNLEGTTHPGEYTVREIRLNRRMFKRLRKRKVEAQLRIEQTRRNIALLTAEREPKHEIIADLQDKISELTDRYINPRVPYEPKDLFVE